MGWFTDDAPDHEGYPVGVHVNVEAGRTRLVELDANSGRQTVTTIQAGCDCGWRSGLPLSPT